MIKSLVVLRLAVAVPTLYCPVLPVPAIVERPPVTPAAAAPTAAPLDLAPEAGVYERRGVGLLALDAKDSTALHLKEGTRRAHALIRTVVDDAESAASAFDGRVIRRLGDGSLIAFPSYASALAAAEAIQAGNAALRATEPKSPALRVGVHAGRVLVDATGAAPEIYGAPVEKTLALAAVADGGQVATETDERPVLPEPVRAPDAPRPVDIVRVELAATLFAGLDGFAEAFERDGRRTAYAAVKAFHAFAREAVERQGGRVVKTEGDTVMASFPTAAAGVRAAAEIRAWSGARTGLSWGRVIREERAGELDYFGNTVNAAARLMRLAGPGEALISEGAIDGESSPLLEGAARETVVLKGFDGARPVARLKATKAGRGSGGTEGP
ncbi:MAG: hypothetical protein HY923_02660 [Elusimicrobia bacterium]|nr:hypothetical protein [Elusimicrobiota bacterium]